MCCYLPVATVVSAIADLVEGDAHLGAVTAAVELCFRITNLGGFSSCKEEQLQVNG